MPFPIADGLFWASVACCLVAQVLIVRSVLASRATRPTAGVPRSRDVVEVFWALLPAFGLALLLFFTWRAMQRTAASPAAPAAPAAITLPA